jgi:hypothetical protein
MPRPLKISAQRGGMFPGGRPQPLAQPDMAIVELAKPAEFSLCLPGRPIAPQQPPTPRRSHWSSDEMRETRWIG